MGFGGRLFDLKHSLYGMTKAETFLNNSQYWDRATIEAYQYEKLLSLLTHCSNHVPFYRMLFADYGFNPKRDFKELTDLSRIPALTKKQAIAEAGNLQTQNLQRKYITERTSGSTGMPFAINISDKQITFEKATVWRHWRWTGYNFRRRMAIVRTFVPQPGEPLITDDKVRNFRYYSAYHLNEENAATYLKDIRKFKALYLRGYPSSLYILARLKNELAIEIQPLKAILTASETLSVNQRHTIETAFNTKIYDWYGLAEQVVTANECEKHEGLHLNSEYGYLELERRHYLAENERMIVGTNFHNYAMPLLRYETGDIAIIGNQQTCSCGRNLPLIAGISGRKDDIIVCPDRTFIPATNFYSMFREFDSVKAFQIIQHELNHVEIRIHSDKLSDNDKMRILTELKLRLGQKMKITIALNKKLKINPQGKRRPVMSYAGI